MTYMTVPEQTGRRLSAGKLFFDPKEHQKNPRAKTKLKSLASSDEPNSDQHSGPEGNEQQPSAETESNNVEPRTGVKKEIPDVRPHQRNDNDRKPKQSQTRTVEAEINEVEDQADLQQKFPKVAPRQQKPPSSVPAKDSTQRFVNRLDQVENRLLSSIHKQGVNLKRLKQELNELKNEIELMRRQNYTMMNDIEDLQVHELREEIVNLAEQQQLLQEAMLRDQIIQQNLYQYSALNYLDKMGAIRANHDPEAEYVLVPNENLVAQNYWMNKLVTQTMNADFFSQSYPNLSSHEAGGYPYENLRDRGAVDDTNFHRLSQASGFQQK
ncbi:uncharacterized protein LOC142344260 isoform X2 [Convolutriloba macropyga]